MAVEDEKKQPSNQSYPPPPLDPFPNYQSPFPRRPDDNENPFIQFRRFADEQFQSFFSGLPQLFGFQTHPDTFKRDFEEILRKGHEMEEGWRKHLEQDMEEARQLFRRSIEEHEKAKEAQKPWWTKGKAANCPALNGEEISNKAKDCPALFDKDGAPKTELDAYEGLDKVKSENSASTKDQQVGGWLGYDGRRAKGIGRAQVDESDGPQPQPFDFIAPTRYHRFHTRRMDPFENPSDTIPWLVLNPYSPVYLCNPGQAKMFKVHIQDNEGAPMQISRPRFVEVTSSEFEEKMAKQLPWADAFEDLVSLQQTGKMVDRNYSTYRTPSTWIHDMVSRGSLGPKWGFNDNGQLTKMASQKMQQIEDKPSADEIVKAITERENEARQAFGQAVTEAKANDVKTQKDAESAIAVTTSSNNWSSSSASSSWSSFDTTSEKSGSIISTLTRTESRTLPDGSVETRRMLKRRFADGREEAEESVDIHPATSNKTTQTFATFPTHEDVPIQQIQPATPVQNELKKQQKKGGWFWN